MRPEANFFQFIFCRFSTKRIESCTLHVSFVIEKKITGQGKKHFSITETWIFLPSFAIKKWIFSKKVSIHHTLHTIIPSWPHLRLPLRSVKWLSKPSICLIIYWLPCDFFFLSSAPSASELLPDQKTEESIRVLFSYIARIRNLIIFNFRWQKLQKCPKMQWLGNQNKKRLEIKVLETGCQIACKTSPCARSLSDLL